MKKKIFLLIICIFFSFFCYSQWQQINGVCGFINCLAANGSDIYAGTGSDGVFYSSDNGNTWTAINTGLTHDSVSALILDGGNVFAGTHGGVFLSSNNGGSWALVSTGMTNTTVNALAKSGMNIFAGTGNGGVFISTNNGNNWTAANTSLTSSDIRSLAVNTSNIFAGSNGGGIWMKSLSGFTGIESANINTSSISIFPNPAKDRLYIDMNDHFINKFNIISIFTPMGS